MWRRSKIFHVLPAALAVLLLSAACAGRSPTRSTTSLEASIEAQDLAVVEVVEEKSLMTRIELPIPSNPYEDATYCKCVCAAGCAGGPEMTQFEKLISKLRLDAGRRAAAAAEALLASAAELVAHDGWKEVTENTMELLSNPTVVMVPAPGGKLVKVSLEKLPMMDLPASQIISIRNNVQGKMQAAIAADMVAHGVPGTDAKKISSAIMKAYMKELLAPAGS